MTNTVELQTAFPHHTATEPVPRESVVITLVGSGGDGISLLGDLLLGLAAKQGLHGMMVQSYGPQIRGGESAAAVRLAREDVAYEGDYTDILLCFRLLDMKRFAASVHLHDDSLVMLDAAEPGELPAGLVRPKRPMYRYPFATIANGIEVPGDPKNMPALALLCRILGWDPALAEAALRERLAHRPESLVRNLAAFAKGLAAEAPPAIRVPSGEAKDLCIETGNEAVARGAMDAGLKFSAGYPITPSSEILETLLDELPARGGRVVQAEDEMAALGMVIGASFGGAPSMTATSGPGLSLMTELIGLSAMAEIPTVIVDCQRAGPSTGMPSRTEQSDLDHAIRGGHGEFPRAVLGVLDVVHAREVTYKAFHLAETWQLPVLVLSDAYVAQRRQIRGPIGPPPPPPGRRVWRSGDAPARFHLVAEDGVSPFHVPGEPGGTYLASGIEHGEQGFPSADGGVHQTMNDKRFKKLDSIAEATRDWFVTLGKSDAPRGIVAWGSTWGVLREFVAAYPEWRCFLPEIVHPFPVAGFEEWRRGLEALAVVELSHQGQFFRHLASETDLSHAKKVARGGGAGFSVRELAALLGEKP